MIFLGQLIGTCTHIHIKMGAAGWRRFVPYEVTPIIGAGIFVSCLALYRLYSASKQPEVRFTKEGGLHHWEESVKNEPSDKI